MKKLRYILMFMVMGYLLSSCVPNRGETMIKLYDGSSEQEIEDPSSYTIISFAKIGIPNALAQTVANPSVWFGGGIPLPGRYLESLEADEKGIFHEPETDGLADFMVVLNKEKSLIACYVVGRLSSKRWPGHPREGDLRGRAFCDVTCKDMGIGEEGRREYYRKLFDDIRADSIFFRKMEYEVKRHYRVITEDRGTGERYMAPLYIGDSHPAYMLPCKDAFDEKGEIKNFFGVER